MAASSDLTPLQITPETVIRAYCHGIFPMARHRRGAIDWYRPDPRTIMPLKTFHVPRSLRKRVRSGRFDVQRDQAFEQVIRACAQSRRNGDETWISESIIDLYCRLHEMGVAHSVEAWQRDKPEEGLIGGLYGVALGGAFFGESMFSLVADASKVCLVHLVEHLCCRGFILLDVQYVTPHLEQFGVIEISHDQYMHRLTAALALDVTWD